MHWFGGGVRAAPTLGKTYPVALRMWPRDEQRNEGIKSGEVGGGMGDVNTSVAISQGLYHSLQQIPAL